MKVSTVFTTISFHSQTEFKQRASSDSSQCHSSPDSLANFKAPPGRSRHFEASGLSLVSHWRSNPQFDRRLRSVAQLPWGAKAIRKASLQPVDHQAPEATAAARPWSSTKTQTNNHTTPNHRLERQITSTCGESR